MSTNLPRSDASCSRSPLHGPTPYNPPLTMGSIESSEFFTRWRPVLVMAQFHDLAFIEAARNLGGLMNTYVVNAMFPISIVTKSRLSSPTPSS